MTLRIGGLTPFSSMDFPGHLAAVVHLQGCPLACPYCHSPQLQRAGSGSLTWEDVRAWLIGRRGLLDGVVFSGGEPCAQSGLGAAVDACRDLGFAVGLHSSGIYPEPLRLVLGRLDWIGFDWKAPPTRPEQALGRAVPGTRLTAALDLMLASGVAYEIRTTYHPAVLGEQDLIDMAEALAARRVRGWVIQEFSPTGVADPQLRQRAAPLSHAVLATLRQILPAISVRSPSRSH